MNRCITSCGEAPVGELSLGSQRTPCACRAAVHDSVLIVVVREYIVVFWFMFSTKSPILPFMCTDAFLNVFIQSCQFGRGRVSFAEVVWSGHHVQYLCWYRFLIESVPSSRGVVRCCFEYNYAKDLLISLAVCWKGTLVQGGLHLLSVSVPVGLF